MRNLNDIRTVCIASLYFVFTYILWAKGDDMGWFVIPMFLLVCGWSWIGATITHNTMHCRVFKERWANKAFQLMLTLTYGHPVSTYVPGHNLSHHRFTQLKKDIMRTQKLQYKWNFLNLVMFQPKVSIDVLKSDMKFIRMQQLAGRPFVHQAMREFAFLFIVMATLAYMDIRKFFFYFHFPHLFGQWGIVTINLLQHDGCDIVPEGETKPNYNHSRNFTGWLLNFLTMNNGYHTIHHMNPTMHWSEYKDAHEKLVKPHIHPALEQKSLIGYMIRATVYPGIRETYDHKPVDLSGGLDPDEDWMEYPEGIKKADVQLSLRGCYELFVKGMAVAVGKTLCPIWSPFMKLA